MKKVLIALVIAVGTFATLESCSKESITESDALHNTQADADEDHDKDEEPERPN